MAQRKIRVLCLHGAMLSSAIFRLQLAPYLRRLETEHNCTFHFVDAPIPSPAHKSIAAFYDEPCYRYFHWAPSPTPFSMSQVYDAYDFLYKVIKEHGPFDGVMGFSQGAVTSVALLLHHAEAHPGEEAPFRFAVLFSCPDLPAGLPQDGDRIKDNKGDTEAGGGAVVTWGKLGVPSLHVCGKADEEWFEKSLETFREHCEEGSAALIVHDGEHAVPKDKPTVDKVVWEIGDLIRKAGLAG